MKLLISPAKKMREDGDFLAPRQAPALLERAAVLAEWLRGLDYTALKKLLACNDGIAELNFRRFQEMDLRRPGTPALLSYDGIQYQYMAPHLFTRPQFEYAETHLRILSGFYGVLRPFDGVLPYRLEMGARCSTPFCKSLYDFWGDSLYRTLTAGGEDTLLNLASAEYAKAVRPWVTPPVRWIDVTFGETDGDKVVEKGVYVKMARGEMVRFLAERNAETPEAAQGFDRLGYRFSPAHSTAASYVFFCGRGGRTRRSPCSNVCSVCCWGYLCGCFLTAELVAPPRTGKSAAALGTGNPRHGQSGPRAGKGLGGGGTGRRHRQRPPWPLGCAGRSSPPWAACPACGPGWSAVLGHNFPPLAGLPGRKGVAVTCAALILFSPWGDGRLSVGLAVTLLSPAGCPWGAVVIPPCLSPRPFSATAGRPGCWP